MLDVIRRNKKSFVGLLLAGFMAFLMVGFGMQGAAPGGRGSETVVIKVNDHEISAREYDRQLMELTAMARQQLGPNFNQLRGMMNLEQRAIDSLIEERVFRDLVGTLQLNPSTSQVEAHIARLPFFQKFGLNRDTFKSFLQSQGMTGEMLEQKMRESLAAQQLQRVLTDISEPSRDELKAVYREQNASSEFSYAELKPDQFASKVDASDEAKLQEFLKTRTDQYMRPRTVRYSYVKFEPSEFLSRVDVAEEDVRELYEQKQSQFYEPKQYKLRQIAFEKTKEQNSALEAMVSGSEKKDSPSNTAKKELAKDVVERLKKGEDFGELAKKLSEDKTSAQNGGEIGWIASADLDPIVREIVDRMDTGKYSDVIETDSRFLVTFLDEVKERKLKAFDEVRAGLESELRQQDAPVYARAEAEAFFERFQASNLPLAEFAAKEIRPLRDSDKLLSAKEDPAGEVGLTSKLIAFSKGDRQLTRAGDFEYIAEITETKAEYLPEFKEIAEAVKSDYIAQESRRLAKETAEQIHAAVKGGKSLEEAAKEAGVEVKSLPSATKSASATVPFFSNPENRSIAFALDEANPIPAKPLQGMTGEWFVIKLKSRTLPDEKQFEEKLAELRTSEKAAEAARLGAFVSESLRAGAQVWVDPKLLEEQQRDSLMDTTPPGDMEL